MDIFTDVWKPVDEAAKIMGINPEDVELLITGMTMVAENQQISVRLVNLKAVGDFIKEVQRIKEQLTVTIKPLNDGSRETIKGKQAAKIMLISYEALVDLCEKKKIKAQKKSRGWRIEEKELKDFMLFNKDLLASLRDNSPAKPKKERLAIRKKAPDEQSVPEKSGAENKKGVIPDAVENHDLDSRTAATSEPGGSLPPVALETDPPLENSDGEETTLDQPQGEEEQSNDRKQEVHTIRKRKHNGRLYCRIDDVASSFHPKDEGRVKRWINAGKIKAVEAVEGSKVTWYIEPESLKKFMEENGMLVTFEETR